MLPNHAPLRIAEAFRTLAALHPGRIDLGLGRAPGSDGRAAMALRRAKSGTGDDFPELLHELLAFGGEVPFAPDDPLRTVRALPDDVPLPPVWLLGSSDYGARLAAQMGLGYAFAHHFSADWVGPATRAYREGFRPTTGRLTRPHLIVTVNALVAPTDAEADVLAGTLDLWAVRRAQGQFAPLPSLEDAKKPSVDPAGTRVRDGLSHEDLRRQPCDGARPAGCARRRNRRGRTHDHDDGARARTPEAQLHAAGGSLRIEQQRVAAGGVMPGGLHSRISFNSTMGSTGLTRC